MQELQLDAGQDDNFSMAAQRLEKYLRVKCNSTQIDRLVKHYGEKLEHESEDDKAASCIELAMKKAPISEGDTTYVMMDGCLLQTREQSDWKEMKLGRVFNASAHYELTDRRKWIKESLYVSHFGGHNDFLSKLEPLVDEYEKYKECLVFINDGAKWIWKWIDENYPDSTQVLDYYHAAEYLGNFAKVIYKDKSKRTEWVSRQKLLLLNDQVEQVIQNVSQIQCKTVLKKEAQKKLLTYYTNNKKRMKYKTYKDRGILIGSGPIESAHRTVIQKRLKQSGQRWTIQGAQCVANLRVNKMSGLWSKVIDLIKNAA